MPLANSLLKPEALNGLEIHAALAIAYCPKCQLVQTTVDIDPKFIFEEYLYRSSFSDTMLAHSKSLVKNLINKHRLNTHSFIVEIASNDGYLLKNYLSAGIPVMGIDPAANIAVIAETENNVPTLVQFFNSTLAKNLTQEGKQANIIHAHNVLAHVPDPNELMQGFEILLKAGGEVVIEVPYVRNIIENVEFDGIYHEHFSYFSLTSLEYLTQKNGLIITDVEQIEIHGGSLRVYLKHNGSAQKESVKTLLDQELSSGIGGANFYNLFAKKVKKFRSEFTDLLYRLKADGKSIAAYGASARGATLLNFTEIDTKFIDFVADRSPLKHHLYLPGIHIPIVSPEEILVQNPDYVLILTWTFAEEIIAQQNVYKTNGGRFIIPFPKLRII
jgi:SAM-dependent methyltransferase